jgi:hypothetical protein
MPTCRTKGSAAELFDSSKLRVKEEKIELPIRGCVLFLDAIIINLINIIKKIDFIY